MRASKKLRNDELLVTALAGTRLCMELDRVPLWRGDHVAIKQLVEDFARYLYLPRLKDSAVLPNSSRDGLSLLLWQQDSFAYADSFDEAAGRYRGLRSAQLLDISAANQSGLLVRPEVAIKQQDSDAAGARTPRVGEAAIPYVAGAATPTSRAAPPAQPPAPRRFHGSVNLDATRVGRDAGRIADEVIAHLAGLVGSEVKVTLEIEAEIPSGASDQIVRTVTENSRTLNFTTHGFESE